MNQDQHAPPGENSAWVLLLGGWLFASTTLGALDRPARPGTSPLPLPKVHLDSSSPRDLRRIPGIGPTRALSIAEMRWAKGAATFDLQEVHGIGETTQARALDWLANQ